MRINQPVQKKTHYKDKKLQTLLLVPTIVILLFLTIFPILYSIYVSFTSYDTFGKFAGFAGMENYIEVFKNKYFWAAMQITLIYTVFAVTLEMFLGFSLALSVSKDGKIMNYLRWVLIIPMMLSPLVVSIVFKLMLNMDMGIINYLLQGIGIQKINFLGDRTMALLSLILVDIWQWTPMCFLILLAGLQSLPHEPFEAANIDGASKLQMIRFVTLPMLKPVLIVALVIRTMDALRTFDQVFVLTRGGPGRSTETISYLMYRETMKFSNFGYSAAGLFIVLILTVVISYFLIRLMSRSQAGNMEVIRK